MEQVEQICENIVLINKGKNVLEGLVSDIKDKHKEHIYKVDFLGKIPENIDEHANIVEEEENSIKNNLSAQKGEIQN